MGLVDRAADLRNLCGLWRRQVDLCTASGGLPRLLLAVPAQGPAAGRIHTCGMAAVRTDARDRPGPGAAVFRSMDGMAADACAGVRSDLPRRGDGPQGCRPGLDALAGGRGIPWTACRRKQLMPAGPGTAHDLVAASMPSRTRCELSSRPAGSVQWDAELPRRPDSCVPVDVHLRTGPVGPTALERPSRVLSAASWTGSAPDL